MKNAVSYVTMKPLILIFQYYTSENGKLCSGIDGIQSAQECIEVHTTLKKYNPQFKDSEFATIKDGYELPFGCISDTVSQKHYVYWNSEGSVISSDPRIKLICKNKNGQYSCKTF